MFKNNTNNNENEFLYKNHFTTSLNSTKNLIIPKLKLNGLFPINSNNNNNNKINVGENDIVI